MTFLPGLEGLRGVAVLAVLLFHAGFDWAQGGFLGVSTFFTLSGYLITRSLVEEHTRDRRVDLPAFWVRRVRRLAPAAIAALLLIALYGATSAHITQLMRLTGDGLAALIYLSNWWFIATDSGYAGLLGYPSPVQHFWSLSIEEQFYVVFPILLLGLLALSRDAPRRAAAMLALLTFTSWAWMAWLAIQGATTERLYYGTDTRCGELLAGGALALLLSGRSGSTSPRWPLGLRGMGLVGLAISGLAWATAAVDRDPLYLGGLAVYTLASAMIIASTVLVAGPTRTLLSSGPLRWLGRISYGAYIYHWPIYLWLEDERVPLVGLPLALARIVLTLALAQASYTWLEEPIRRGVRLAGWRGALTGLAAGAAAAGALLFSTRGVEQSHTLARLVQPDTPITRAAAGEPLRIMVVGDSVAKQFAEGLAVWGQRSEPAFVMDAAAGGCGLARGARGKSPKRSELACDDWKRRYLHRMTSLRPDIVAIYTAGWDLLPRRRTDWSQHKSIGDPEFDAWLRSEYAAAVEFFGSTGAHVAWISPLCKRPVYGAPIAPGNPAQIRILNEEIIPSVAEEFSGRMTYIDLFARVCPEGQFSDGIAGISPFRPDGNHFSRRATIWVGSWLGRRIAPLRPH